MTPLRTALVRTPRPRAWRTLSALPAAARWPLLRLHWRRLARPAQQAAAHMPRPAAAASWLTHIHLHFATVQAARQATARGSPAQAAQAAAALRASLDGAGTRAPASRLTEPGTAAAPTARAPAAAPVLAWRALPAAGAGAGNVAQRAARAMHGAGISAMASPVAAAQAPSARLMAAPPALALSLAWKCTPTALRRAPLRVAGTLPGTTRAEPAAAHSWRAEAPALVWRKAAGAAARAEQAAALTQMDLALPAEAHAMAPPPAAAHASAVTAALRQQLGAGPLDAALADRLAHEVIRRVERSMRIERERRGH